MFKKPPHITSEGFVFNGRLYNEKHFINNYYHLVRDILDYVHGPVPDGRDLKKMFGATVHTSKDTMPTSVLKRELYKPLNDIYVLTNKDIKGLQSAIARIGKVMKKDYRF